MFSNVLNVGVADLRTLKKGKMIVDTEKIQKYKASWIIDWAFNWLIYILRYWTMKQKHVNDDYFYAITASIIWDFQPSINRPLSTSLIDQAGNRTNRPLSRHENKNSFNTVSTLLYIKSE